ncbi:polysaccharide biosynthesis tyrosine autokinase [Streptacidiphilus melanogenes]|uniref:polysaccharide biosynthesis tyrosine autokinase n=1 Tax=Streptacidiphilus melanogenes TaxID=411235 RepID=UPI001364A062|nr:polysaccharide biosynthesis tyrosine autokinase [Streptacidiphilus melanogenes]
MIKDRWKLIVVVTVLAGAISAGVTARTTRMYSSGLTFFVSAQIDSSNVVQAYQANLLSQQKVQSYANLLTGHELASAVVQSTGLSIPTAQLQSRISAQAVPQTVLLRASVTSESPYQAQEIARAIARIFPGQIDRLEHTATGKASTAVVQVVEPPSFSPTPVSPEPLRNVGTGLALGLLAGLALAAAARSLDTTLKTADQVTQVLGGKPVLGVIPYDPTSRSNPVPGDGLLTGPRMEAFRKLRVSLGFIEVDTPRKVLMFTSALPNDGKSTTVCNLAIALGTVGTRTVLVECDMRRPQVGKYLGLPNGAGLTDVLLERARLEDVIQTWGDDSVDVLTSGVLPPNPGDLLGSRKMEQLIERLRERYEVVLLDMPPALALADAAAVGQYCDGAIIVARHGRTRAAQLRRVCESLASAGTPVLAGVLNMVRSRDAGGGRYGYGYGYYEAEKEQREGARLGGQARPGRGEAVAEPLAQRAKGRPGNRAMASDATPPRL